MRLKSRITTLLATTAITAGTFTGALHANMSKDDAFVTDQRFETQAVEPTTASYVAMLVLQAAEQAVKQKLTSVMKDKLFGSDGPDVVHLSQQSIDRIKQVVDESNFEVEANRFQTDLEAYDQQEELYHEVVSDGFSDQHGLQGLNEATAKLISHHLFDNEYNPQFFMMTGQFAAVASSRMAVLSEYRVQGEALDPGYQISDSFLKSKADELAIELTTLGNTADQYVASRVTVTNPPWGCSGAVVYSAPEDGNGGLLNAPDFAKGKQNAAKGGNKGDIQSAYSTCEFIVRDSIKNRVQRYSVNRYGYNLARNLAYQTQLAWRGEHQVMFKGDRYDEIVASLQSFAD